MEANEIETAEEAAAYRAEYAAEIEAEESGNPIVDKPGVAEPEVDPVIEKKPVKADPFAGVDPAIKAMFDDLSSKVTGISTTLEPRLKQTESRIGAITNKFNAAEKAAGEAAAVEAAAPTKEQVAEAARSDEAWEELAKDFPDWATAFDGRMNKRLAELKKELAPGVDREALNAEVAKIKTEMKGENELEIQKAIISFAHPDWQAMKDSKEFREWLPKQTGDIADKYKGSGKTSDLSKDAIFVLDAFKGFKEPTKTAAEIAVERTARLRNAVVPTGKKAVAPKSEADMTTAELRTSVAADVWAKE